MVRARRAHIFQLPNVSQYRTNKCALASRLDAHSAVLPDDHGLSGGRGRRRVHRYRIGRQGAAIAPHRQLEFAGLHISIDIDHFNGVAVQASPRQLATRNWIGHHLR